MAGVKAFSVFGEITLPGTPRAIQQVRTFEQAGQRAANKLGLFSAKTLLVAGGLAAIGGAATLATAQSVRAFADFDGALTQSLAIMGDVSEFQRRDMVQAAREVGRESVFAARDAAESYFFLTSAGLSATQSIRALPLVTRFAQAGMFDMARATDLLTDAQSALGLTVRDDVIVNIRNMARVSDVLVKANTLANATVEQFAESLTNDAGAALRLVNKDVEEGVAVLAAYADQGEKGVEAGTKLGIVFRDLQRRAIENRDEFARLNIAVFDNAGNMRNIADIIADIERALAGMSDEQQRATITQLGFADRSVTSLLTLLGTSDAIREYERQLRDAGGTTEDVAERQMQTLSRRFGLLKSALTDVALALGGQVTPSVVDATDNLTGMVDAVGNVVRRWEEWRASIDRTRAALERQRAVERLRAEDARRVIGPGDVEAELERMRAEQLERLSRSRLPRGTRERFARDAAAIRAGTDPDASPIGFTRDELDLIGSPAASAARARAREEARVMAREREAESLDAIRHAVLLEREERERLIEALERELATAELTVERRRELELELHDERRRIAADEERAFRLLHGGRSRRQVELENIARDKRKALGLDKALAEDAFGTKTAASLVFPILGAVDDAEDPFVSALKDVGLQGARGLAFGFADGADFLEATILSVLQRSVVGLALRALGIASPSRVFEGMGRDMVRGMVTGIEREQATLLGAMTRLLTVPAMPSPMASASGATASPTAVVVPSLPPLPIPTIPLPRDLAKLQEWQDVYRETARQASRDGFRLS